MDKIILAWQMVRYCFIRKSLNIKIQPVKAKPPVRCEFYLRILGLSIMINYCANSASKP